MTAQTSQQVLTKITWQLLTVRLV